MPVIHGLGLALHLQLDRLRHHHGIALPPRQELPPFPASSVPMEIRGLALSSTMIDSGRVAFKHHSLSIPVSVPLLYRHSGSPVGTVNELEWRPDGLHLCATVDDDTAKRARGLSIAATVLEYELCEVNDPARFHGLITAGVVTEVTITPIPACGACQISSRVVSSRRELQRRIDRFTRSLAHYVEGGRHVLRC